MSNAGLNPPANSAEPNNDATEATAFTEAACVAMESSINLDDSSLYLHRELSQLQFNIRVLEQALDPSTPC